MKRHMKRNALIALAAVFTMLLYTACGSARDSYTAAASAAATEMATAAGYAPEAAAPMPDSAYDGVMVGGEADVAPVEEPAAEPVDMGPAPAETGGGGMGGSGLVVQQGDPNRKIVITVDLGLETKNFDGGVQDIAALTEQAGGYIQNSYVSGSGLNDRYISRTANYTARIPTDRVNEFLLAVSESFNVIHQQQSADDISMGYYDTESRLKSLRVQEQRLLEMLEQAGALDDLLRIEKEYAEVLYEIENYTSSLNRMDDSVNLSTVTMSLYEVVEYEEQTAEPATFGERVLETLGDSWDGFVVFCEGVALAFIALLPFLPLFAVIAVVVILLVRRAKKRAALRPRPVYQPMFTAPPPPAPEQPKRDEEPKE